MAALSLARSRLARLLFNRMAISSRRMGLVVNNWGEFNYHFPKLKVYNLEPSGEKRRSFGIFALGMASYV